MSERGYQYDFSVGNAPMHDVEGRARKALTMVRILDDALGGRFADAEVLNLGCSTGIIDDVLAQHARRVLGIDIDAPGVAAAQAQHRRPNLEFRLMDGMRLELPDASFDVVICSQVYEHVPDPARMLAEIHRVLRPGGVCYFAATNRLRVMEQHYYLPFLSIVPVPLAHWYLRLLRRGTHYHERHLTYWSLRRLVARFAIEDYTRRAVDEPERFGTAYMVGSGLKRSVVRAFARVAYWAFPGYLWVLRKGS